MDNNKYEGDDSSGDDFLGASVGNGRSGMETDDNGDGDGDDNQGYSSGEKKYEPLREQDRFLPIANITKIMKKAIPENGKIAKDARETIQECVSEFISFITSEAGERCNTERRKTLNGDDIIFAMSNLGFDEYIEPMKTYLKMYRESVRGSSGHFKDSGDETPGPSQSHDM